MPGNPREMITMAERQFPVRIRIAVPQGGLGQRYGYITAWLDQNCGSDGWAITPSGSRGVLNDAISIYFADATLASAFVARWVIRATKPASIAVVARISGSIPEQVGPIFGDNGLRNLNERISSSDLILVTYGYPTGAEPGSPIWPDALAARVERSFLVFTPP